jgi:hypothetical protein
MFTGSLVPGGTGDQLILHVHLTRARLQYYEEKDDQKKVDE